MSKEKMLSVEDWVERIQVGIEFITQDLKPYQEFVQMYFTSDKVEEFEKIIESLRELDEFSGALEKKLLTEKTYRDDVERSLRDDLNTMTKRLNEMKIDLQWQEREIKELKTKLEHNIK